MTLLTGITPAQLEELEQTFAVLTEDGWALPEWLVTLQDAVLGTKSEIVEGPSSEV